MEKLYQNKDFLYEQYINQKKSTIEIAEFCNCSDVSIQNWLRKFEIEIRNNSEAQLIKNSNAKYKIRDFLYEQYIIQQKSTIEIAKECNVKSNETIINWLKRFEIPIRNNNEACNTERSRKRNSEAHKGKIPWNKGKAGIYSSETLKLMRESHKKENLSSETLKLMSDARKGKKNTPETKKKQSEAMKRKYENGCIHPMKDKHHTPESKQLISRANKGRPKSEEWKKKMRGDRNPFYGKGYLRLRDKNPNWNPNRAERYAPYGENFYNELLRSQKWNL